MNVVDLIDIISLFVNASFLLIGGYFDRKYRMLPLAYVVIYGIVAAAFIAFRLASEPSYVKASIAVASVLVLGLVAGVTVLAVFTRMVGSGDVLVVVLSFIMTPYVPRVFSNDPPLPLFVPLAVAVGVLAIVVQYYRETEKCNTLPSVFKRVVVKTAGELKSMKPLRYYPVYVPSKGVNHSTVFGSRDPIQASIELLNGLKDDEVVYTVPSYPFVFYYAGGFIFSAVLLLAFDIIAAAVWL